MVGGDSAEGGAGCCSPAVGADAATSRLNRDKRLVCVEYPGVVQDVDKTLLTLGGEEGVSRVRMGSERPLKNGFSCSGY